MTLEKGDIVRYMPTTCDSYEDMTIGRPYVIVSTFELKDGDFGISILSDDGIIVMYGEVGSQFTKEER